MRIPSWLVVIALCAAFQSECFAQRGGRPGGMAGGGFGGAHPGGGFGGMSGGGFAGGGRPGGGFGGGAGGGRPGGGFEGARGGGGFGGGFSPSSMNRSPEHRESMSPFGSSGGARPGFGAGGGARPEGGFGARPGFGTEGAGGLAGGARPGFGAAGFGRPETAAGARPGFGTGTGAAAERANGIGTLPAYGAGRLGVAGYGLNGAYGTRYMSGAALADQAAMVRGGGYRTYDAAMFASYNTAWVGANYTNASLYAHPGYYALAAGLNMTAQPVPYDYGGNVVVQGDSVYVNGDATATTQEYADQANQLAAAGRSAEPDEGSKWTPLGVFALVAGDATNSDDVFQIAVNPQGIIRGNYHQVSTNQVVKLSGSVDRKTQRASWAIGDDAFPIYDTGVANLTKDATPILIHLKDGQTQQMNLVRLEQPDK